VMDVRIRSAHKGAATTLLPPSRQPAILLKWIIWDQSGS